ncbi:MAG TPA: putative lipid II flippase FtsW [Steroidobacteraceae bacterium]|nr:putative lipid II flippase FtsW [Steroidobacteraceae bacterium]HRX91028.1 putative lipid II flippase FtsW [Steroidobacteraceae bacterium]
MNTTATFARSSTRSGPLRLDVVTVLIVCSIVLLGLVMVTSASMSIAAKEAGEPFLYLERQLVLTLIGVVLAGIAVCVPTALLEKLAWPLLIAAIVLLIAVLIPGIGHSVNGSRRWIRLLGFNFQASELARVLVLIFLAGYAVRRENELRAGIGGLLRPIGLLGFIFLLLLAQPDFGAASVLLVTGFGVLFLAGARLRDVLGIATVLTAGLALLVWIEPYRMRRLTSFLDPWADPFDSGFQLTQSLIAIGRGEWFGVGLGESVQKLFYLPEAHTDFLFAVLAEELGLIGVIVTLALFLALVWRSFWIARAAFDSGKKFAAYLAAAFGIWIGVQSLINIGVNMGVLPTKGLTLPLMSYGRSSLIVTLAWVGVLLRVYHEVVSENRGAATVRGMPRGQHGAEAAA